MKRCACVNKCNIRLECVLLTTKSEMKVLLNPPTTTNAITPVGSSIVAALISIPESADIDALPPSRRIAETINDVNRA